MPMPPGPGPGPGPPPGAPLGLEIGLMLPPMLSPVPAVLLCRVASDRMVPLWINLVLALTVDDRPRPSVLMWPPERDFLGVWELLVPPKPRVPGPGLLAALCLDVIFAPSLEVLPGLILRAFPVESLASTTDGSLGPPFS